MLDLIIRLFIIFSWLLAAAAKSLQSCPTLCDPIEGSPPGSPILGILQARTLEWVAIFFSNAWKWKVKVKSPSRVRLLATPQTAAHQAPPSMGFPRQEYWSGLPLPSPSWLLRSLHINQMFLYHGHNSTLILKISPIVGFAANYLCLILLDYFDGFLHSKALIGPKELYLRRKEIQSCSGYFSYY